MMKSAHAALALTTFALAACAAPEGDPPSLGPRVIESVIDRPVRAIAPVAVASDAALAARIAELVSEAERGESAFRDELASARRTVSRAAGSAPESESWIEAQMAVSALDRTRTPTASALGALDGILSDQTLTGEPAETTRLLAARERVAALYARQAESFDALLNGLRPR